MPTKKTNLITATEKDIIDKVPGIGKAKVSKAKLLAKEGKTTIEIAEILKVPDINKFIESVEVGLSPAPLVADSIIVKDSPSSPSSWIPTSSSGLIISSGSLKIDNTFNFNLKLINAESFKKHKVIIQYQDVFKFTSSLLSPQKKSKLRSKEYPVSDEINVSLRMATLSLTPHNLNVTIILLTPHGTRVSTHSKTVGKGGVVSIELEQAKQLFNYSLDLKFNEPAPIEEEADNAENVANKLLHRETTKNLLSAKVIIEARYNKRGVKYKRYNFDFKPLISNAVDLVDVESLESIKVKIVTKHGEILEEPSWSNLKIEAGNDDDLIELTLPRLMRYTDNVIVKEDANEGPNIWTDHKVILIYDIIDQNYNKLSTVEKEYDIQLTETDDRTGKAIVDIEFFGFISDIKYQVKSPRGEIIGQGSKKQSELIVNGEMIINVPPRVIDEYLDILTYPKRPKKTIGYVIDKLGKIKYKEVQVIIYATKVEEPVEKDFYPIHSLKTNAEGSFNFITPRGAYTSAFAVVGIDVSDEDERKAIIRLEEDIVIERQQNRSGTIKEVEHQKLFFPQQIILVVNKPVGVEDEDCGCGDCKELDFHKPRKVLEEFTYYSIVRTTEPQIRGLTLMEDGKMRVSDFIDLVTDFDSEAENELPQSLPQNFREMEIDKDIILKYTNSRHGLKLETLATAINESKARELKQRIKPSPINRAAGRRLLDANNPIDWDEDPTIYQATSLAHGHLLQFKQEWVNDGYSLGDLLYSLPLAPGQKKQIVTFDWERREAASGTEMMEYQENLNNSLSRDRDINEIANGSISQNMNGGSNASTESGSSAWGAAGAVGGFAGVVFGIGGGFSKSSGSSSSSSNAWQNSSRDSTMNSLQQLRDNTTQAASAVRSQRSTVIQTVSQGESFSVETESVANYNHCHALTIQYFEVLRHFQIQYRLSSVQECLFIPLEMGTFDTKKALRWRESLSKFLLNDPYSRKLELRRLIRSRRNPLMRGFDAIERRENSYENSDLPDGKYADSILKYVDGNLYLKFQLNRPTDEFEENGNEIQDYTRWGMFGGGYIGSGGYIKKHIELYFEKQKEKRDHYFETEVAPLIASEFVQHLKVVAVFEGGGTKDLDIDFTLMSSYKNNKKVSVSMRMDSASSFQGVKRSDIVSIKITTTKMGDDGNSVPIEDLLPENSRAIVLSGYMGYKTDYLNSYLFKDSRINNDLVGKDGVSIYTPLNNMEERNPRKEDQELANSLLDHLNDNLEYYHHVIWSTMNPRRRFMFLDGIQVTDYSEIDNYPFGVIRSVASVVENKVIGVEGNCLIMPVAPGFRLDPNLKGKNVDLEEIYMPTTPIEPTQVSIPTKGVFAEAVMGKCNSCEKKEEDRFWRWEESPIPDSPTGIQQISTDSRRSEPLDTSPTPLSTPIVNIQNSPSAPDPTGLASLAQLLANPNFENITGLDGNQRNALQGLMSSYDTTKAFGQMASGLAGQGLQAGMTMAKLDAIKEAKQYGNISEDKAQEYSEKAIEESFDDGSLDKGLSQIKKIDELIENKSIDKGLGENLKNTILKQIAKDEGPKAFIDNENVKESLKLGKDVSYEDDSSKFSIEGKSDGLKAQFASAVMPTKYNLPPNIGEWEKLFNHEVEPKLIDELQSRGIVIQDFDNSDPESAINLDQYRIRIDKLPKKDDGSVFSEIDFLNYVRLNLNELLDTPWKQFSFKAYDDIAEEKWNSEDYLGALLQFDTLLDDLGVVVSEQNNLSWIFTTIRDSSWPIVGDVGTHPVHGHREFGLIEEDSNLYFYTKGADRQAEDIANFLGVDVFEKGHDFWIILFSNLVRVIKSMEGEAFLEPFESERYDYNSVKKKLKYYKM